MTVRSTPRVVRAALVLLALVAFSFAAPGAFARSSFGISLSVPGLGISYSEHGRHNSWNGYVSGGYSSYGGYGYGGAPYYPSYSNPYYSSYYGPAYGGHYGSRNHYRPSRVVYYDRHDRGNRGHRSRYDDRDYDRGRRDDRSHGRDRRSDNNDRGDRRGGYYDRDH